MRAHLFTAAAAAAIVAAGPALAQDLKLMTGPQGGSWYPLGGAIQNIAQNAMDGVSVTVLPGAGIANVKAVEAGKVDLGFANSVSTVDAIQGNAPFETKAQDVCNVATLYPQYFQVVALADSDINSPADLKGKADSFANPGSTSGHFRPMQVLMDHVLDPVKDVKVVHKKKNLQHAGLVRGDAAAIGVKVSSWIKYDRSM